MDQLLEMLQSRAGLSREQAEKVIPVVADFLKNNLSDAQVEEIVSKIPGLSQFADKLPDDIGDKLSDGVMGFLKKND